MCPMAIEALIAVVFLGLVLTEILLLGSSIQTPLTGVGGASSTDAEVLKDPMGAIPRGTI